MPALSSNSNLFLSFNVAAPTVLFAKEEDAEIHHHGPEVENWPGLEGSVGLTLLAVHEYYMTVL